MELLMTLVDFVLHVDRHLRVFVETHGAWVYALLFLILFVETGLVVMPFLPGDSLLFVVGALAGLGLISYPLSMALMIVAAIAGDQTNYAIGRYFGPKVFKWEHSRWFNKRAFDQAHAFYERYGGITIVVARFMPFLRTFAPFVAGVAEMTRSKFTMYNIGGGVLWVVSLVTLGYLFGNLPWVQQNLSKIIWAMIIIPGVIVGIGALRARSSGRKQQPAEGA
jgi:membrane-associated protein